VRVNFWVLVGFIVLGFGLLLAGAVRERIWNAAADRVGSAGPGLWADRRRIVCARGARLPDLCVRCGEAASARVDHALSWTPDSMEVHRRYATVQMPLCERHTLVRRGFPVLGVALVLLGATSLAFWIHTDDPAGDIATPLIAFGIILELTRFRRQSRYAATIPAACCRS
jgi:hypothetical protein